MHLWITHDSKLYQYTEKKRQWIADYLEDEGYQYVATLSILPINGKLEIDPGNILDLRKEVELKLEEFRIRHPDVDTVVFDATGPTPFAFAVGQVLSPGRFKHFLGVEPPKGACEERRRKGSVYIESFH